MEDKLRHYKSFFADQKNSQIEEQQKKNNSKVSQLFKSGDLSLGYVERVIPELGYVVIKFPRYMAPRLKVLKNITIIKAAARQTFGERPTDWACLWGQFCDNAAYHAGNSDITPMYYTSGNDAKYDYVACAGLATKVYDTFVSAISQGKSLPVLVYDPFPPTAYYSNLSHYVDLNENEKDLLLEPKISYDEWQPEELMFDENNPDGIWRTIAKTLEEQSTCIVQGPPGTGKSFTIASIIAEYLRNGKSVCVTTMANKGLVELIQQDPLADFLNNGKICKTNLSIDERKIFGGKVHNADKGLHIPPGELLCATNYVLSGVYSDTRPLDMGMPHYDLLIIEEASQAFLTTIVAFKALGDKCLIVGDPMQLPPIVRLENPLYNSWNVNAQVEGLTTYALGSNVKSYRIVTTFRLTERSAYLTKLFYGNRFLSVKKEYHDFSEAKSVYMPNEGGVLCCCTGDVRNAVYSEKADEIIRKVLQLIEKYYAYLKVAIVTPYRHTVQELQKRFGTSDTELELTIETVDRIQGMTVDYAIFYIPGRNPGFALESRRFNVATSRSKSTTLIITDFDVKQLGEFHSSSPIVINFLSQCDQIVNGICQVKEQQPIVENLQQSIEGDTEVFELEKPKIELKIVNKIDLSQFERPKKELKSDKKNYYIIDTNVFVNCPDIITKIDKKYPIILSAKVTDELDKMKIKLDERGKQNAEKALRLLNNESSHEIIYEFADTSLLPEDFDKRSPDNMIISVALKYKSENPIMLTSDNGLQLKSKILGISTVSLRNFLKR